MSQLWFVLKMICKYESKYFHYFSTQKSYLIKLELLVEDNVSDVSVRCFVLIQQYLCKVKKAMKVNNAENQTFICWAPTHQFRNVFGRPPLAYNWTKNPLKFSKSESSKNEHNARLTYLPTYQASSSLAVKMFHVS